MTKRAKHADVFDVYGKPPPYLTSTLSARQTNALRRYVYRVTAKVYRLAFDLGMEHGIDQASEAAHKIRETLLYIRPRKRARRTKRKDGE